MTTQYLEAGWYDANGLRAEVIDGAMDAAGTLFRAGITSSDMIALAVEFRLHTATFHHRPLQNFGLSESNREHLLTHLLQRHVDVFELDAMMRDLLEHITSVADTFALYIHLLHIGRLIALYESASSALPAAVPEALT